MIQNTHQKNLNKTLQTILKHNVTLFVFVAIVSAIILHISINAFYNTRRPEAQTEVQISNIVVGDWSNTYSEENQLQYLGLDHLSDKDLKKMGFICSDLSREECQSVLKKIYGLADDGVFSFDDNSFTIFHTEMRYGLFNTKFSVKNMPSQIQEKQIRCDISTGQCRESGKFVSISLNNMLFLKYGDVENIPADEKKNLITYTVNQADEPDDKPGLYKIVSNFNGILTIENALKYECGKNIYKVNLETQSFEYEFDYYFGCDMGVPKN